MLQTELKSYLTLNIPLISGYWSPYVTHFSTQQSKFKRMLGLVGTTTIFFFFFFKFEGKIDSKNMFSVSGSLRLDREKYPYKMYFLSLTHRGCSCLHFTFLLLKNMKTEERDKVYRELIPSISVSVSCLNIIYQTKINPYRFSPSHKVFQNV